MIRPHAYPGLVLLLAVAGSSAVALASTAEPPGRSPTEPEAYYHYSLAQQLILDRDYMHALEQMENAVAKDASPALLLELAQLRFSLNDLAGAADLAEKVATSEPGL